MKKHSTLSFEDIINTQEEGDGSRGADRLEHLTSVKMTSRALKGNKEKLKQAKDQLKRLQGKISAYFGVEFDKIPNLKEEILKRKISMNMVKSWADIAGDIRIPKEIEVDKSLLNTNDVDKYNQNRLAVYKECVELMEALDSSVSKRQNKLISENRKKLQTVQEALQSKKQLTREQLYQWIADLGNLHLTGNESIETRQEVIGKTQSIIEELRAKLEKIENPVRNSEELEKKALVSLEKLSNILRQRDVFVSNQKWSDVEKLNQESIRLALKVHQYASNVLALYPERIGIIFTKPKWVKLLEAGSTEGFIREMADIPAKHFDRINREVFHTKKKTHGDLSKTA